MKNAKYYYLKNYFEKVRTFEDKEINKAFDFLTDFYDNLPERTKGIERQKEWSMLINFLVTAFDKQIEKIANCPYLKIEIPDTITNTQQIKDMLNNLKIYADIDFIKSSKIEAEEVEHGRL